MQRSALLRKKSGNKIIQYGFVSTGNLNEKTSKVYADECMLTSNRNVMADINRIFKYLENPSKPKYLSDCKTLLVCPVSMRHQFLQLLNLEIKHAKAGKKASLILKVNSLSDPQMIHKLYEAADAGVELRLIVRGICSAKLKNKKWQKLVSAISIVDEYLEHSRVMIFHHGGKEKMFISSADWMLRNLDHRIEAAIPIKNKALCQELKDILHIQLQDNVKARILDNNLQNEYVKEIGKKKIRAQIEAYNYLFKKVKPIEISSN
jgi:polyphosphate kinase